MRQSVHAWHAGLRGVSALRSGISASTPPCAPGPTQHHATRKFRVSSTCGYTHFVRTPLCLARHSAPFLCSALTGNAPIQAVCNPPTAFTTASLDMPRVSSI
eukprot:361399-Chlamydomonas_euryale.AAC.8